MDETIEQKLDRLADYESQKDLIDANKRAALDEVKVPAEVEAIVSAGTKRMSDLQAALRPTAAKLAAECDAKLAEIVIPAEIKAAYEEVERQRALVMAYRRGKEQEIDEAHQAKEKAIRAEIDAQVKETYADVARRKREIEEEFAGNIDAVKANIDKLKAEIKADTIAKGETVKGKFYQSVFVKGRTTWKTDALDSIYYRLSGLLEKIDSFVAIQEELSGIRTEVKSITKDLAAARKEGDKSTQLKTL